MSETLRKAITDAMRETLHEQRLRLLAAEARLGLCESRARNPDQAPDPAPPRRA